MHIFLYEWATGGGLVEETGSLPASLVREGAAMIRSLAADFTKIQGCQVSALRDPRMLQLSMPGCALVDVLSTYAQGEEFDRLAAEADATVLIAPEFDEILLKAARRVIAAGGKLLGPSPEFIRLASNKQRTSERLTAAGVPTPQGIVLESDEPLPGDFAYPAVIKPLDGAGSQDTYLISGPYGMPGAYAWPRRLERYMPGFAASVAVLCGPNGKVSLAPCRQRISEDGRFKYLGGELPITGGLAERARSLAERAVSALPPAVGYIGLDMVLGPNPHGDEDAVIEVNPRLTTSYVGLRAVAQCNLGEAMKRVAGGESVSVPFSERPVEFDVEGNVSFIS